MLKLVFKNVQNFSSFFLHEVAIKESKKQKNETAFMTTNSFFHVNFKFSIMVQYEDRKTK